jgi:hypothetical protein
MKIKNILLVIMLFFVAIIPGTIAAQTNPNNVIQNSEKSTEVKQIEYALPYPGMLPDHPLYFLKNLRDHIMDFIIRDHIKKAEFNLLLSDKKLAMFTDLYNKNNFVAAKEILTESLERRILLFKSYDSLPGYIQEKAMRSSNYNISLIQNVMKNADPENQEFFQKHLMVLENTQKKILPKDSFDE